MHDGAAPPVSIGLPVYNGERFLAEAIEDHLAQTFGDFELIISDNASTDGTRDVCEAYAARDARIRYTRLEENLGAAPNFNRVFGLGRGEFFKWAACDDRCAPTLIERCLAVLRSEPDTVLAYPKTLLIAVDGTAIGPYEDRLDLRQRRPHQRLHAFVTSYDLMNAFFGLHRRRVLATTNLVGPYVGSDYIFLVELCLRGRFHEIPERLFLRRDHESNVRRLPVLERARWFDTRVTKPSYRSTTVKLLREQVAAIRKAPLLPDEKLLCYAQIGVWCLLKLRDRAGALKGRMRRWSRRSGAVPPAGPRRVPGRELPRNVCLFGASFETGNRGVSALAASLVKLFATVAPASRISFFIDNCRPASSIVDVEGREVRADVLNCRLSPRARLSEHLFWIVFLALLHRLAPIPAVRRAILSLNPWLSRLAAADFVGDIGAGDSFSDIYGLRRLIVAALERLSAVLLGKRAVLLPQTYGPFSTFLGRAIGRFFVRRAARILSRDAEGISVATELAGTRAADIPIGFCPDVAFVLDPVEPAAAAVDPPVPPEAAGRLVGFNVSGLLYRGGYTRDNMFGLALDYRAYVEEVMRRILEDSDASILLVPHTYGPPGDVESDPEACDLAARAVAERHRGRVHTVRGEYGPGELKAIIGRCRFFIGSRMHACIAAISQGIPTIGVSYSRKFRGVFEAVDLGDTAIDARSADLACACERTLALLRAYPRTQYEILERVGDIKDEVLGTFRLLAGVQSRERLLARA